MRRGGNIDRSLSALALAVLAIASGFARAAGGDTPGVRVEASFTSDDNVTRAAGDDALSDSILGVRVNASAAVPMSTHARALVQGFAGAERFNTYAGLSRNFIGAQGDFKYRASGEFGAATYGAFARTAGEYYESSLRDGYRHALGATVLKPATDRVQFFGAITYNIADGNSAVFDAKSLSLRGNADWSPTRWDVVYFGLEYRRGDAVATARPSLTIVNSVDAIVRDDAFDDTARFAYRFKASSWLASLGYNRAFAERHSVDISWRGVKTTPSDSALSEIAYVVNQFSLAYLVRF